MFVGTMQCYEYGVSSAGAPSFVINLNLLNLNLSNGLKNNGDSWEQFDFKDPVATIFDDDKYIY